MPLTTKTLRSAILGSVYEFANTCQIGSLASASNLSALAVTLSNYLEEGQSLIPEVYLCNDIKDITQPLLGSDVINIGKVGRAEQALLESVKKCSPLAKGGWSIFLENKRKGMFNYGVFRSSLNPLAASIEKTFFSDSPIDEISVVRVQQTAKGCVELKNTKGHTCHLLLNDKPDNSPPPNEHLSKLINIITSSLKGNTKEISKDYINNILGESLKECHGSLIAVLLDKKIPDFLEDGILLDPPIDFPTTLISLRSKIDEEINEHKLHSYKSIISGMISSDGIVVFDTNARLLAFNCFIRSPGAPAGKTVNGGARTRAYEALSSKVKLGVLKSAFIKSQDGWTKLRSR